MVLLEKERYSAVRAPLLKVTINNLFARAVVENKVNGRIFVDNGADPNTFYVIHPYGLSLLFGESDNDKYNARFVDYALNTFQQRRGCEWMQAFPDSWNKKISNLFGGRLRKFGNNVVEETIPRVEEHTRVNFVFNRAKYLLSKSTISTKDCSIVRTDKELFCRMNGTVVPKYFWNDAEQFVNMGVGYSLFYEEHLASCAYSAFVHDDKLEIGIETAERFQGKGFALFTCCALIDYCLENNLIPVWSCRLQNTGSYRLAEKLGFEPTIHIPFYRFGI